MACLAGASPGKVWQVWRGEPGTGWECLGDVGNVMAGVEWSGEERSGKVWLIVVRNGKALYGEAFIYVEGKVIDISNEIIYVGCNSVPGCG